MKKEKCPFCGRSLLTRTLYLPCGYHGCTERFCCFEAWADHADEKHPNWQDKEDDD